MLAWDSLSRLMAVIATFAVTLSVPDYSVWLAIIISFGLSHYLLAFYYARAQLKFIATNRSLRLPGITLLVVGGILYLTKFPLAVFFAIHHAFNEGYLRPSPASASKALWESLNGARALLHGVAYLLILRHEAVLNPIPDGGLWIAFVVALALYLQSLNQLSKGTKESAASGGAPEVVLGVIVLVSLFAKITFYY